MCYILCSFIFLSISKIDIDIEIFVTCVLYFSCLIALLLDVILLFHIFIYSETYFIMFKQLYIFVYICDLYNI